MTYKDELTLAMTMLAEDDRTIFLGQSVRYPGQAMFKTLEGVPMDKRIEMPLIEDSQMGMSIGLSLMGYIPISLYTRMDFLIIAMNQLVNHLDKIEEMSHGEFKPRVIIRTLIGSRAPLDGGIQHTQDYTQGLMSMLKNVDILTLSPGKDIVEIYGNVLKSGRSAILVEYGESYATVC